MLLLVVGFGIFSVSLIIRGLAQEAKEKNMPLTINERQIDVHHAKKMTNQGLFVGFALILIGIFISD